MARTSPLIGIAAALLVALAGCVSADDATGGASSTTTPSATATQESSSTPAPMPTASDEPEGVDTSNWLEYSTHDGDMTYRHPADWTLSSESSQSSHDSSGRWYDSASLTAPNGQALLQSGDFVDIGGACGEDHQFPIEVLASEPADVQAIAPDQTPQITTVALGTNDGRWTFGVGITSMDRLPEPGATGCAWYFVHASSDGGVSIGTRFMIASIETDPLWTVDSLDDAIAYMETDEYATILEILRSVRTS